MSDSSNSIRPAVEPDLRPLLRSLLHAHGLAIILEGLSDVCLAEAVCEDEKFGPGEGDHWLPLAESLHELADDINEERI